MRSSVRWISRTLLPITGLLWVLVTTAALAKEWPNRVPTSRQRGEELYARHCVACHGKHGRGDGPLAEALVAPVPDVTGRLGKGRTEELVEVILVGRRAMPGFARSFEERYPWGGDFSDAARDVLEHLRRVSRDAPEVEEPEPPVDDDDDDDQGDLED